MEAPKIPSFFKTKYQFKRFEYKPRFYDPEKEAFEIRKKRIEDEVNGVKDADSKRSKEEIKQRMKYHIQRQWHGNRQSETRKSNFRIAFIVAIMVVIVLLIKQKMGI